MNLLHRLLRRRPRTVVRPVLTHCTLQAVCDRRVEKKIRALCFLAFADTDTRLHSLHTIQSDGSVHVLLQMTLTADSPAAAALERLAVRLTREPQVRDLRWQLHTSATSGDSADRPIGPGRISHETSVRSSLPTPEDSHGTESSWPRT
ncbi:hypothetical protein [Streptomyces noursei]|uniref:hypothetical protein n=1 Tax=Streptomyces noursei TaxID=1971 RepID=UPI0038019BDA